MLLKSPLACTTALAFSAIPAAPANSAPITFEFAGGILQYTVTQSGLYEIGVMGANDGKTGNDGAIRHGGHGIGLWGEADLLQGELLRILVGGGGGFDISAPYRDTNDPGGQSGDGGGSFVVTTSGQALVVAGCTR